MFSAGISPFFNGNQLAFLPTLALTPYAIMMSSSCGLRMLVVVEVVCVILCFFIGFALYSGCSDHPKPGKVDCPCLDRWRESSFRTLRFPLSDQFSRYCVLAGLHCGLSCYKSEETKLTHSTQQESNLKLPCLLTESVNNK